GVRYLSMEYLEADTLSGLIRRLGNLSVKQSLSIGLQVASGIEAIHSRGIVHRDLKPSNIAVDREGRVAVMDFGLARGPVDSEVTQPGVLVGSYAYLAPEHIRGDALTAAADIYALGLVLYEMLTGRRPPGDDDQRPLALRGEDAKLPRPSAHYPDVPAELDAVIVQCLSWKPEERPEVLEVRAALEKSLKEEEARTIPIRRAEPASRTRALILAAGLMLALGAALAVALWHHVPEPTAVALLPFEVEAKEPRDEIFGAMSEDGLSAGLRAVPGIRVTVVEPDLREKPEAEILRAVGAEWLVRGKVSVEENGVRWHPELVGSEGRIEFREAESLDLVRERILEELGFPTESASIASLRTSNLEAYRKYLKARSHHDGWDAEGDIEKARSLYREALELDEHFTAAQAGQALASAGHYVTHREAGDLAVARYASDRALASGESLPETHLARGTLLASEERWEEARKSFARAFELSPGDYASRRNVAHLYETLGRSEEARELYERTVKEAPLHWLNHYWYGSFLYRAGDFKSAPVYLERARELESDAEGPVTYLGFHRLAMGDLDQAKREFERALELQPDSRARKRLALVHYYVGDFERALELWSQVLEAEPADPSAHGDVADALRQLGRSKDATHHYETAIELFDRAMALEPDDDLLAQRAQVLAAAGECREAKSGMESVLAKHPEDPSFLYYGALAASRCRLDDWASELVLKSIGAGNVVGIWFDPDLDRVRHDPRVRRPLELIGTPQ
ncbi:MAG: protein kinase domain-containing protein, partial [Vicinamibacteria bacterium]